MARFQYQALSASGEIVAGEIDGPDVKTVIARLNEQALLPIEATEKRQSAGFNLDLSFGRRNGFPQGGLTLFVQQLTRLLNASLPLDRALEILTTMQKQAETGSNAYRSKPFAVMAKEVASGIAHMGNNLAEAERLLKEATAIEATLKAPRKQGAA